MKRIRLAFTVVKIFMKNQMQDKTNIILDAFNMVSRCLIVFLLYHYIFKINGGMINGVDYKTTMWSMFIYFCIMILNIRRLDTLIMEEVKSGNVEMFMNKPTSYLGISFYKVIGKGLFSFLVISLIGTLMMILFVGVPSLDLKFFIPTLIITFLLGQILGLLMYGSIGLLSFFIQDVKPIHWIVDKAVMILGGSYLPISMFPKVMKILAFASPFGAVNFASSTVYAVWKDEAFMKIGMQVIWIVIFTVIIWFLYNKSKQKMVINGG